MAEALAIYVSGFWPWLGITIGLGMLGKGIIIIIALFITAFTGIDIKIGDDWYRSRKAQGTPDE